jgi:hypothetical protein
MSSRPTTAPADALAAMAGWRIDALCADIRLTDAGRTCLAAAPGAAAGLAALVRAGCHRDAVSFLAHALPRPQAVRWACECVQVAGAADVSTAARVAVAAGSDWARAPDDVRCEVAAAAAGAAGAEREGAARFAAFAAAWSGASLAPAGQPPVAPAAALGAAAVAAAVLLAATQGPADTTRDRLADFIGRGVLHAGRDAGHDARVRPA